MRGRQFAGGSEAEIRSVMLAWANRFDDPPEQRDESIPSPWRCMHDFPILVLVTDGGSRRAQCLGCKSFGPEGVDSKEARKRLLAAAYSL
jgi:hypothetical protein